MTRKFIFLDIDGVMKPGRSYFCAQNSGNVNGGFDPLAVATINRICEKTGAQIVFNTTWNNLNIIDIAHKQGIKPEYIVGKTSYPNQRDRLTAILHWLEDNDAKDCEWIALDDVKIKHEWAINVDPENGISTQNYRTACRLLGKPDVFMLLL